MTEGGELKIEFEPHGSKLKVIVSRGDEPLHIDVIDPASENHRKRFVKAVRDRIPQADAQELDGELISIANRPKPKADTESDAGPSTRDKLLDEYDHQVDQMLKATPAGVRADAESMLDDPALIDRVVDDIAAVGVVGEQEFALSCYLIGTSRLLDRPLAGICQGPSSSGKSYTIDRAARLFPDEAVVRATDMSAQALYYLQIGSLMHRFVVAGERSRIQDDSRAEATRALREMLSAGELHKLVTISPNREQETARIYQPGPISYVESTTSTTIFDEDQNRCLLLATDESAGQTRAIVTAAAESAEGRAAEIAPIIIKHHAAQRMLRRVDVLVPFAGKLAAAIPVDQPQARRAIHHVIDTVRTVALLHQRQRADGDVQHGDTIQATVADYVVARRLLFRPIARALGAELSAAVVNFAARLSERFGAAEFDSTEATISDPVLSAKRKVNEYLAALADSGAVQCVESSRGPKPTRWRLVRDVQSLGALWLPTVEMMAREIPT